MNLASAKLDRKVVYDAVVPRSRTRSAERKRLSADERKASIVAAATEVFAELGYQRGTMSEVARRLGVTEPVVFQNFGSKPAVFAAVLGHATEQVTATMRQRVEANGSVGAWLTELLASDSPHGSRAHGAQHVLFAEAMSHAPEPAVKAALRRSHRVVARTLADLLARGQAEGSVRSDLDVEAGAWWLVSFLASRGLRAAIMPQRGGLEAQVNAITLQALTGNH